jgi:hypothetical protein
VKDRGCKNEFLETNYHEIFFLSWALVDHACNPSNLGAEVGRTEIRGKVEQIVLETPISKITRANGLQVW